VRGGPEGLSLKRKEHLMRDRIMTRSAARRRSDKIISYERGKKERRKGRPFMVALQDCYRSSTRPILGANALILETGRA
jgi:hypothetical protein